MIHDSVDRCIYCDATSNLSDEHVFAYGLGGNDILPKASCVSCAKITSAFEQDVLRGLWWLARAVLNFPSRRPKEMPTEFRISVETKNGISREIVLSENEKFGVAGFPEYASPAFLASYPFVSGILMTGHRMVGFGNSLEDIAKKYDLASINGSISYKGTSFARMLAKIALGVAVARFGLDNFEEIYVRNCILDKRDDVGMWVGSDYWAAPYGQLEHEAKSRHASSIGRDDKDNVLVRIRLFSFSPFSPAYLIVVGRLHSGTSTKREGTAAKAFSRMEPLNGANNISIDVC